MREKPPGTFLVSRHLTGSNRNTKGLRPQGERVLCSPQPLIHLGDRIKAQSSRGGAVLCPHDLDPYDGGMLSSNSLFLFALYDGVA